MDHFALPPLNIFQSIILIVHTAFSSWALLPSSSLRHMIDRHSFPLLKRQNIKHRGLVMYNGAPDIRYLISLFGKDMVFCQTTCSAYAATHV